MKFITFEGPEGSGKSTQSHKLSDYLVGRGYEVLLTREPGGTWIGEAVRKILLDPKGAGLVPETELLLYMGVRALHVRTVIAPALRDGKVVICDRFIDASVAYQGYGRGIDIDFIKLLNDYAICGHTPALTFILNVDVESGLRRAIAAEKDLSPKGVPDRMEAAGLEFHRRVLRGYQDIAGRNPDRVRLLDTGGIDETFDRVRREVDSFLLRAG